MNSCTAQGGRLPFQAAACILHICVSIACELVYLFLLQAPLAIITGDCVQRVGGRWQWQVWQTVAGRLYTPLGASLP